ncbi:MAG TPA: RnfABCDGE type electron transport complex subunit D [Dongiaceae bacterium]|nr:RnfABCDGE type electron transport complex subunit D [Dongiaceae bacterium]
MSETTSPTPFVVAPGPHVHASESTTRIMWWVNAALAPASLWGVWVFGWPALAVAGSSIAGAIGGEWLAQRWLGRKPTIADGSAFCTGLLLALTLPPRLPWYAALLGGAFAILIGKSIFGGLGFNLFNPALIGRAFLMASFPLAMTAGWSAPRPWFGAPLDAVTTPTPLAVLREHGFPAALAAASAHGSPWMALLLGLRPGSIGEVSVVLVALGAAVLLARGIIGLAIPLSVLAGVALVTLPTGHVGLHLASGGLWLGAFFMATDYVTSPNTRGGQIVFGLVIGVLTGVIRLYGGYPEGICYAILLANALVPALNLWFRPRRVALVGSPS